MLLNPMVSMLSILGVTMAASRFSRERKEVLLFTVMYAFFCVMFLATVVDIATWVAPALRWCGLAGFLIVLVDKKDSPLQIIVDSFTPGIVFFILAALVSLPLFQSTQLQYWDEFSHWGLRAKEFAFHGSFYGYAQLSVSAYYPPGTAVWAYFVNGSQYSEFGAYFAQFLLLLAPASVLFARISWRESYWSIPAIVTLVYLITAFGHGIASLYVDHLLGMVLGGILLAALIPRDKVSDLWVFLSPLAALPLIKEAGTFCAISGVIFVVSMILVGKQWKSGKWKHWLVACLILFAIPFVASASWNVASQKAGIEKAGYNDSPSVAVMIDEAVSGYQGYRGKVWERLSHVVWSQQVAKDEVANGFNEFYWGMKGRFTGTFRLSTVGFFALFLAVLAVRGITVGSDRKRVFTAAVVLSALFWAYMAGLFWVYLYGFLEENALRIPSYLRYTHIFLLPLFLCAAGMCLPLFSNEPPRKLSGAVLITVLLVFLYGFETPNLKPLHTSFPGHASMREMIPYLESAGQVAGADGAVLVIMDENKAAEHAFQYMLAPIPALFIPAGKAVSKQGSFSKLLNRANVLFVLQSNKQFAEAYPTIMSAMQYSPVIEMQPGDKGLGLRPVNVEFLAKQ